MEQILYSLRKITEKDFNFIYEVKKNAYKKYVEANWGVWEEEAQIEYFRGFINTYKENTYIIEYDGQDIGFYNGEVLEDGKFEIGNICIIPEFQGKGIGGTILTDILNQNKDKDIVLQYFKQNPVEALYTRLGFIPNGETKFHYQMIKEKIK